MLSFTYYNLKNILFQAKKRIEVMEKTLNEIIVIALDITGFELEALYEILENSPKIGNVTIYLRTFGGPTFIDNKICTWIKNRQKKFKVRVIVVDYALSAGTMIALAADELIFYNENAKLSPIDSQLLWFPKKNIKVFGIADRDYNDTKKFINSKYNAKKVMEEFYLNPKSHNILFKKDTIQSLGPIKLINECEKEYKIKIW